MSAVIERENLRQLRYDRLGNLALSMPLPEQQESQEDLEKALRISGILQTSLDVTKIIEIFAHEITKLIDYQHVQYVHHELNINQSIGQAAKHKCNYRLVVSGETLGEISFGRRKKFTAQEISIIESLLCGLVYPLRNALLYQKALEAAHRDPLTGVNNRASMDSTIDREINLAHRHGIPLSLLALDIDHFKKINDTHGHAMGDCVIKAVAEASSAAIRNSDIIFRYGGEEFLILLSNTGHDGANLLAERLRQKIEETSIICDGTHLSATVSIGMTCMQADETRETFFARADAALYQAKAAGRNCCKFYIPEEN